MRVCPRMCISPHYAHCADLSRRITPVARSAASPWSSAPNYITIHPENRSRGALWERPVYFYASTMCISLNRWVSALTRLPAWSCPTRFKCSAWISMCFRFVVERQLCLEFWAIMFTACPRTRYRSASVAGCSTNRQERHTLPSSLCTVFLLRPSPDSSRVWFSLCIKHQLCRTAGMGPSTLRQSQPSVEGDRTVRWSLQGTEQFLLLMHPRRQDPSAASPAPHPRHH